MRFPPRFNRRLAIELGELILRAYEQHDAFMAGEAWNLSGGYRLIGAIECVQKPGRLPDWLRPGAKDGPVPIGFLAGKGRRLYLVFRGTHRAQEWLKNLSFNLREYPISGRGNVHSGFLEVYDSARDSLFSALSSLKGRPSLFIAGHSLGGALATLAAPEIRNGRRARIRALYTFASPRVGDEDFVRAFNRDFASFSFRVMNGSDIVPSVPLPIPIGMGGYFSHVETPLYFTVQSGSAALNHAMETYLEPLRRATGRWKPFAGREG